MNTAVGIQTSALNWCCANRPLSQVLCFSADVLSSGCCRFFSHSGSNVITFLSTGAEIRKQVYWNVKHRDSLTSGIFVAQSCLVFKMLETGQAWPPNMFPLVPAFNDTLQVHVYTYTFNNNFGESQCSMSILKCSQETSWQKAVQFCFIWHFSKHIWPWN